LYPVVRQDAQNGWGFYKSKKNGKIMAGDLSIRPAWIRGMERGGKSLYVVFSSLSLPFVGENVAAIPLSMVAGSIIGLAATASTTLTARWTAFVGYLYTLRSYFCRLDFSLCMPPSLKKSGATK
jgi:hypothetical protein